MTEHATHTVGSLAAAHGGPSRSVTALCDALGREGMTVDIVAMGEGPGVSAIQPLEAGVTVHGVPGSERRGFWRARSTPFGRALARATERGGVVHDHGVWLPTNRTASLVAARTGCPFVVSPKGMLSGWALGEGRWKKRAAWAVYQRRALERAQAFSVTSEAEAEDVRRLGLGQHVAVIPHGVDEPPPGALAAQTSRGDVTRTALFLSRIHTKKGLPDLVEAWAAVRPAGWRLVIAGPDEGGHRAEIERQVGARGLGDAVSFTGPVGDTEKWALYGSADLFVLPTRSENFGIVVAEALAAGVPVVTTHEAPWRALTDHRCGWWVGAGAAPVAAALEEAMAAPPDALRAMGERGRAYVAAELSWSRSARDHRALYRWLLGCGDRPPCVSTD